MVLLRADALLAIGCMLCAQAHAQAQPPEDPAFPPGLAPQCRALAARLQAEKPGFPHPAPQTVHGMLTWHASACERPPSGPGLVVQLCEGKAVDGSTVFFWEKTEGGRRSSGFLSCG